MKNFILIVFGTRPEAIKMAPIAQELKKTGAIDFKTCITSQHSDLIEDFLDLFPLPPDYTLPKLKKKSASTTYKLENIIHNISSIIAPTPPSLIMVHGDTLSALAGAITAYLHKIPLVHIEAGLRTNDLYSPWPEEGIRKIITSIAQLHFPPTQVSKKNLIKEGVNKNTIIVTGNTVIDSLKQTLKKINKDKSLKISLIKKFKIQENKKNILVTAHRTENYGHGIIQICTALTEIAASHPDVRILYISHPNPEIYKSVKSLLKNKENIEIIKPQNYLSFVFLLTQSHIILTDSGGIQEETCFLGKPTLVMRQHTERPEAIAFSNTMLIGNSSESIKSSVHNLLTTNYSIKNNKKIYGSGNAAKKIVSSLQNYLNQPKEI